MRWAAALLAAVALLIHLSSPPAHGAAPPPPADALAADLASHCVGNGEPASPAPHHGDDRSDCEHCICPNGLNGAVLAAADHGAAHPFSTRHAAALLARTQPDRAARGHNPHRPRGPPSIA